MRLCEGVIGMIMRQGGDELDFSCPVPALPSHAPSLSMRKINALSSKFMGTLVLRGKIRKLSQKKKKKFQI